MDIDTATVRQRRCQIGLVLFFCISLLLGLAGSFVKRDSMPNFREQRSLAPFPTLGKDFSFHGLPASLSKFAADNFGFRKPLISTYFKFRYKVLMADLGLPAQLGDDGWLFFDQEMPAFRHQDLLTDAQTEQIRNNLDAWCEYSHQRGAELVFFIAPNKSTIYPEKVPPALVPFSKNPSLIDQFNAIDFRCRFVRVDLRNPLLHNRDELLYYKWGTHWNDHAAQLAWNHIKDTVSAHVPDLRWPEVRSSMSYRPARPLEDSMWQWFGLDDPYTVRMPVITFAPVSEAGTGAGGRKHQAKMLVFGDSFLESMFSTAHVVANNYSSFVLRAGDKFSYRTNDAGKDAWLIAVFGAQRNIELMNLLQPNLVMLEVVERNVSSLADLPLPP